MREGLKTYLTTAYDTLVLIVAKAAFVANPDHGCWTDVGITDRAFAVTLIA